MPELENGKCKYGKIGEDQILCEWYGDVGLQSCWSRSRAGCPADKAEKPEFKVLLAIPSLDDQGHCQVSCPLAFAGNAPICVMSWDVEDDGFSSPDPQGQCPRARR